MAQVNIVFAGVGGQGIVLASRIVARCAFLAGFEVKQSEIHGMAQRGGSVEGHVRFGPCVYAPSVHRGDADILAGFEELETLRHMEFLKSNGSVILNTRRIIPSGGKESYPENVQEIFLEKGFRLFPVDCYTIAKNLGNQKAENMVLLGAMSRLLSFEKEVWEKVIQSSVPASTIPVNLAAFFHGRDTIAL